MIQFIISLLQVYIYIVIARAVVSWFSPNPSNQIWRILCDITEPPLGFIRKILRRYIPSLGAIDISPIILILVLNMLIYLLIISSRGLKF